MSSTPTTLKYFAFISYSREDSKAAAWLQKRLEWFRYPVKLVPDDHLPPHPRYVRQVYRDKTNLEVSDKHYWEGIRQALEESRFLIILCSPHSAKSSPVELEVSHFLATHDDQSSLVVPVILSGSVTNSGENAALCPSLRALGEKLVGRNLPLMVPDIDATELDAWEQGFVALVSYLLKIDRKAAGDHIQSEMRKQAKTLQRWLVAVSALTLLATVTSVSAWKSEGKAKTSQIDAENNAIRAEENARQALENENDAKANAKRADKNADESYRNERKAIERGEEVQAKIREAARSEWKQAVKLLDDDRQSEAFAHLARAHDYDPDFTMPVPTAMVALQDYRVLHPSISLPEHKSVILEMAFLAEETQLITICGDGCLRLWDLASRQLLKEFGTPQKIIQCASFSIDGKQAVTGFTDGTACTWDITSFSLNKSLIGSENTALYWVAFSPDGKHVLTSSSDGGVRLHVNQNSEGIALSNPNKKIGPMGPAPLLSAHPGSQSAVFSPDGSKVLTGDVEGNLHFWDSKTGRHLQEVQAHSSVITHIEYSPDQKRIVTASQDRLAKIWSSDGCKFLKKLHGHEGGILKAHFMSVAGVLQILTVSEDETSRVWEADEGMLIHTDKNHTGRVWDVAVPSAFGRHYLTVGSDGSCLLIDGGYDGHGRVEARCEAHNDVVNLARFSRSGRFFATASINGSAMVWEPTRMHYYSEERSVHLESNIAQKYGAISAAELSPDGKHALTIRTSGEGLIWDTGTGAIEQWLRCQVPERLDPYGAPLMGAKWDASGNRFFTISDDGEAHTWSAKNGEHLGELPHDRLAKTKPPMTRIELSPNGSNLAIARRDSSMHMISNDNSVDTIPLFHGEGGITALSYSPDSTKLAIGTVDGTIITWNNHAGSRELPKTHKDSVTDLSFDPKGKKLASASYDKKVHVADLETGLFDEYTHKDAVQFAQFSKNGRFLLTAAGSCAFLIDPENKQTVEMRGHQETILCASFSPDNKFVITGGYDALGICVWDSASGAHVGSMRGKKSSVAHISISPLTSRLLVTYFDGSQRVWELPILPAKVPQWWPEFLRCVAGREFKRSGELKTMPFDELDRRRAEVLLQIGAEESKLAQIARWHLSIPNKRTVRPDDPRLMKDVTMLLLDSDPPHNINLIPFLQPNHPLYLIAVASKAQINRTITAKQKSQFTEEILKHAVETLPVDRQVRLRAAELLEKQGFLDFSILARKMAEDVPTTPLPQMK